MAKQVILYINQGADWSNQFTIQDYSGNVVNLTGYTTSGTASSSSIGITDEIVLTTTVTNPTTGQLTVSLTSTQTTTMIPGVYFFDVVITNNSTSQITRIIQGNIIVKGGITLGENLNG